jgi:protein-L-isoaspartate(D-aspartate) O-methyltransferase
MENIIKNWEKEEQFDKKNNFHKKIIRAFNEIKREDFLVEEYKHLSHFDMSIPLKAHLHEFERTFQPSLILDILKSLQNVNSSKILFIGLGTGYMCALISKLFKSSKIYAIEIDDDLINFSQNNLTKHKCSNVTIIHGDGYYGLEEYKKYDLIICTAYYNEIPIELYNQLKLNGVLIIAYGPNYEQKLVKITKKFRKKEVKVLAYGQFSKMIKEV